MSDFDCVIWKVEHGSAAFIKTPNGRTIMFDAGNSKNFSPAQHLKNVYKVNSKTNRLDKIIISHPDRDHISDLPNVYELLYPKILQRNKNIPKEVIYPSGTSKLQEPLKTYKSMDEEYNQPVTGFNKGTPITNWGNVFVKGFTCKKSYLPDCPDNNLKNNMSLVSYVRYGNTEIIFPGDLEPYGWWSLLNNTDFSDYAGKSKYRILIAPHHGRESGICYYEDNERCIYSVFLDIIDPHLIIMSDKWGNETTVPELYKPHTIGYSVYIKNNKNFQTKEVLTTKTNDFIFISISDELSEPLVIIP